MFDYDLYLVQKVDSSEAETTEDENVAVDSARNSFSQALKGNEMVHNVNNSRRSRLCLFIDFSFLIRMSRQKVKI